MRSTTYNDDGSVLESVVLCQDEGLYGGDIPKGVWLKLESLEMGRGGIIKGGHSVAFFRCKINRIDISLAFGCKNRDQYHRQQVSSCSLRAFCQPLRSCNCTNGHL